ncbi:DUF4956 domain-containing protein [Humisphaera borealis]|uniref:DUF4956 domain-containing protein n=1 Tax=Humisphaera borealis TaxID=2807512 RepID=A0A7M2WTR6_9BACT|nr:DUF4956 domain-containing protein [Humisphaera borealis]QOV88839.1 DUF4956 domain-containing protein [Humisphaera borealis]
MPWWLEQTLQVEQEITPAVILKRLGIAFVFGCVAAGIHRFTCRRTVDGDQPALAATLVLLAVLIALVMLVIGESVARAFSLAGALAIVRFRTVVEDTRDTAFVMFAVISGMAAGTGYFMGPIVCTPVVLLAAWLFRKRPHSLNSPQSRLTIRMASGKTIHPRIGEILTTSVSWHRLSGLSTARGGTALDATYDIELPPAEAVFTLVDELSRIEGVQDVELK